MVASPSCSAGMLIRKSTTKSIFRDDSIFRAEEEMVSEFFLCVESGGALMVILIVRELAIERKGQEIAFC